MPDPLPICYLNGDYLPLQDARISPLDRGFLFADGVYEVLPVFDGEPYLFNEHVKRLARSLHEIRLPSPHTAAQWRAILQGLIERSPQKTFYFYLQVTRGAEYGRNHAFPAQTTPTVFAMCSPLPVLTDHNRTHGLSAITVEDFRWGRCDIKSTMLLANVLMKQAATEAGANEALIVRDGEVLEGSSTSVLMVANGKVATPPNNYRILPGTTRDAALQLIAKSIPTEVRRITLQELLHADEVWISAATRDVLPVTRVDNQQIGSGRPGPLWQRITELFAADRRHGASNQQES
jgi:D-alanine transaminase